MKAILIETVLVIEALLFWAAALPVALVFFAAAVLWEKAAAVVVKKPLGPAGTGMSPVTS